MLSTFKNGRFLYTPAMVFANSVLWVRTDTESLRAPQATRNVRKNAKRREVIAAFAY